MEDIGTEWEKRWRNLGHCLRRPGSIVHTSITWASEGKRKPGRLQKTWRQMVQKKLKACGVTGSGKAAEMAQDRQRWQEHKYFMVKSTCARRNAVPYASKQSYQEILAVISNFSCKPVNSSGRYTGQIAIFTGLAS